MTPASLTALVERLRELMVENDVLRDRNRELKKQLESARSELQDIEQAGEALDEQPGSRCTGSSCGWCGRCS